VRARRAPCFLGQQSGWGSSRARLFEALRTGGSGAASNSSRMIGGWTARMSARRSSPRLCWVGILIGAFAEEEYPSLTPLVRSASAQGQPGLEIHPHDAAEDFLLAAAETVLWQGGFRRVAGIMAFCIRNWQAASGSAIASLCLRFCVAKDQPAGWRQRSPGALSVGEKAMTLMLDRSNH